MVAAIGISLLSIAAYGADALVGRIAHEPDSVFSVGTNGGVPTAFYNGRPVNLMTYSAMGAGPRPMQHIRGISETGIHCYELPLSFYEYLPGSGEPNFSSLPGGVRALLDQDSRGYIMVRLYLGPPERWCLKHPHDLVQFAVDGKTGNDCSAASKAWVDDTVSLLKKYITALDKSPYGKRIFGYHLGWGVTGEWHYPDFGRLPDTGEAMTAQFQRWLAAKYGSQPEFAQAHVPNVEERNASSGGIFRDPANAGQRRVSDYYRCQQETLSLDKGPKSDKERSQN